AVRCMVEAADVDAARAQMLEERSGAARLDQPEERRAADDGKLRAGEQRIEPGRLARQPVPHGLDPHPVAERGEPDGERRTGNGPGAELLPDLPRQRLVGGDGEAEAHPRET